MKNKNFNWRPMSEYTGGRVLATNGLDVLIGEINSEGDCESEENSGTILCGITGFIKIEEILPESEDDRIRKALKEYFINSFQNNGVAAICGVHIKDVLAWLEMQGEQKPVIDMITPEESLGIDSDTYNKIVNECIYGEQNPDWSEEDEETLKDIITSMTNLKDSATSDALRDIYNSKIDWLKSLRPQNTWKPSDEHYELEEFAKIVRGNLTGISKDVQKLFESKYLQLTGKKMYGGFKD